MLKSSTLLVAAMINQVYGLEIRPSISNLSCVSHQAYRKFDQYLGKVMNKTVSDDVIYCDFSQDEISYLERPIDLNRVSTKDLVRQAAFDIDLVPIPEYVINDAVRNQELTEEMEFFKFTSGDYENLVLKGVQLRERELKIKADFNLWLEQNRLSLPEYYQEDNEDVRFYFASGRDFQ